MAFPQDILNLAHAVGTNFLSVWFGGTTPHSVGDNLIIDDLVAVEEKLGLGASAPGAEPAVLRRTAAGESAWGPVEPGDLADGTKGQGVLAGTTGAIYDRVARKNLLINGDMRVAQRQELGAGVGSVAWTYQAADRWKTLQKAGTTWAVYSHAAVPTASSTRSLLFNSGGNSAKGGAIQIIEWLDAMPLAGAVVSLQAMLLASAEITDIRWALLSWSGSPDVVTNPISAWNDPGVNPTLAANWAYVNTPVNLGVGNWTRHTLENLTVPLNCADLAVMIWCEDEVQTVGAQSWAITDVQLERGAICTSFDRRFFADEVALCQRYYEKSYPVSEAPGDTTPLGESLGPAYPAIAASTAGVLIQPINDCFAVQKRATPTVVIYAFATGTANAIRVGGVADRTGCTAGNASVRRPFDHILVSNVSATAIPQDVQLQFHWAADSEL